MLGLFGRSKQKKKDNRLLRAIYDDDQDQVHSLLADGADPNARRDDGQTALMRAVSEGDCDIVQALIKAGAEPNAQSETGETALMLAIQPAFDASISGAEVGEHEREEAETIGDW